MLKKLSIIIFLLLILVTANKLSFVYGADESSIEELKRNIESRNAQIEALNQEIKILDGQIQETVKEGQTLKSTINVLDASKNKLNKEIQVTQGKVSTTALSIEQLGIEMEDKKKRIERGRLALAESLRNINQAENLSLVETVLAFDNVSDLWNEIESLGSFQLGVRDNINTVESLRIQLADKQADAEAKKQELLELQNQLQDQKQVVEINKSEKAKLLSATQSQEAAFKKQLEDKKRRAEAFRQELNEYESQLKFIIDPTSYPKSGSGVLSWPLADVFVTQYFGDTDFARNNNAYNGHGHNGVDFRASRGTKIMAALSGVIEGTGNTDAVPGCYSYGKWVLIRHNNGLSTLYAHLDLISAAPGQTVKTGEVIGYSGNTGYSTGPHLHFGVYATQGVKIVKYTNSINCKNAVIPVADIRAYLNPLTYL